MANSTSTTVRLARVRATGGDLVRGASPVRVTVVVLAFHALWMAAFFATGHEVRDFIRIGPAVVRSSHVSTVIRYDPTYAYPANHDISHPGLGYDGQYYYYVALDPARARYYMEWGTGGTKPGS